MQQLQFESLLELLVIVAASLLCITVHETCHGLAAYWMGDDTAKRMGRLSLNPLRHIDPMGLVMMALARFGWAKPVPVDMRKFRRPKTGMALTAVAGPVSNVLLMVLAVFCEAVVFPVYYRSESQFWYYLVLFFEYAAVLSAGLAVFNLFPIPPLDGSKVLIQFLPTRAVLWMQQNQMLISIVFLVVICTDILDRPLGWLGNWVLTFFSFATDWVDLLMNAIIG